MPCCDTLSVALANFPHEKGILQGFLKCNDHNLKEKALQILNRFQSSSPTENDADSSEIYRTKSDESFSIERLSLDKQQDNANSTKDTIPTKRAQKSKLHSSTGALSHQMYAGLRFCELYKNY
jgi:hypothetical protein